MPTTIHPKATRRLMALVQKACALGSPQPHDVSNASHAQDVRDRLFNLPPENVGGRVTPEQERQIQAFIDSQTACAKIEIFSAEIEPEPDCVHWEDAHNPAPPQPEEFCGIKVVPDIGVPDGHFAFVNPATGETWFSPLPEKNDSAAQFEVYDIVEEAPAPTLTEAWSAEIRKQLEDLPPAPKRASKRLGIKIARCCRENDLRVGQLLVNAVRAQTGPVTLFNLTDEDLRDYINDLEGKRRARIFEETVAEGWG